MTWSWWSATTRVVGTWPTATAQWEKRNIASEIPLWEPDICTQCNQCAIACPHAAIRIKVYDGAELENAPEGYLAVDYRAREFSGMKYTVQVAPEDCTGCHLCVEVCPANLANGGQTLRVMEAPTTHWFAALREFEASEAVEAKR